MSRSHCQRSSPNTCPTSAGTGGNGSVPVRGNALENDWRSTRRISDVRPPGAHASHSRTPMMKRRNSNSDPYSELLQFRLAMRRFILWSRTQTSRVGLTPTQHLLLLVIRGRSTPPSVGDIAEALMLKHHSAVELVDRAETAGFVDRIYGSQPGRTVRVRLTVDGSRALHSVTKANLNELRRVAPQLKALLDQL